MKNTREKLARYGNHLTFLIRCRNEKIIPKGLRISISIKSTKKLIAERSSQALLRERIKFARKTKVMLNRIAADTEQKLCSMIRDNEQLQKLKHWTEKDVRRIFERTKRSQQAKFNKLLRWRPRPPALDKSRLVVNMSKRVLNDDETILLSRGLNFSVAPKKIPTEEIIASTESLARRLDKSEPGRGTLLRRRVQRCLEKANQPTPNLQSRERRALTTLRKDRSIVILPADKGRATVILDATDYKDKMNQLLSDGSYQKLKRDPTRRIERRIQDELKHVEVLGEIPQQQRQKLSPSFTQPPKLYGLPKIHKVNVPCRPIVSSVDSPTYALAKEMARILSPLAGSSSSYIKNSEHFAEMIESTTLSSCDLLVSFDIKNLFTNVPIPETMSRVAALLHADNGLEDRTTMSATTICKLTELCLRTTYFEFHEEFYEQVNGAAMGSPPLPCDCQHLHGRV